MKIHHNIPEVAGARLQSITSTIQAVTTSLMSTSKRGLCLLMALALLVALTARYSMAADKSGKFLKKGLVFHAKFNGDAEDKSGNGNHGKIHGATFTTDRHGKPGKAAIFDGKSWIEVPGLKLDRHSLTFSAWFKTSDTRYVTSMVSQPGGSTTTGTRIGLLIRKACFATGAGNGPTLLSSKTLNDGVWHHLVGTFDKGQLHLYVDGVLQAFAKFEAGPHFPDESVYIGKEFRLPTTGNDYRYYTGSLDDVRIYNRALPAEQVKTLYDLEKPTGLEKPARKVGTTGPKKARPVSSLDKGLLNYYPFNGNAKDESGNKNDGKVKGATLTPDRHGKKDSAYQFDGKDDSLLLEKPVFQRGFSSYTISCWVLVDEKHQPNATIITDRHGSSCNYKYWIRLGEGEKVASLVWAMFDESVGSTGVDGNKILSPGIWYSVTYVFDSEKGVMKMFLNGKKEGEAVNKEIWSRTANPTYIGCLHGCQKYGAKAPVAFWAGCIDDVRFYNRALSEQEIKSLYDLEKPRSN